LFLALIVTLIIIPFLPSVFDKYKTELVESDRIGYGNRQENKTYFNDLDNDGKSEKIIPYFGAPHILLYDNNGGIIRQINLADSLLLNSTAVFGDYDSNGLNEIYFPIRRKDSFFIQYVEPFAQNEAATMPSKPKFVDVVWKHPKDKGSVQMCELRDLNDDGYKEVIFLIIATWALQPRNLYAYDIANDTILKSPKSGTFLSVPVLYDINDDGKIEIVISTQAAGNFHFEFPYSDNSAWLMVFDHKLRFLFEPVEFPLFTSGISAVPYKFNKETVIAVLYKYAGTSTKKPALYLYNTKGQKIKEKIFPEENKKGNWNITTLNSKERNRLYLIDYKGKGNITQLNEKLDIINEYKINKSNEEWSFLKHTALDIDGDGMEELFFINQDGQKLLITRNDFSYPITVDIPNNGGVITATVKLNGDEKPNLSVQISEKWYLFTYLPNPLYYLKYLIYLGIYTGLFLFLFTTKKLWFRKLEQDKKNLERTIEERTVEIQEQKEELVVQNAEIEAQRDDILGKSKKLEIAYKEIETKNTHITDSIRYAEHIQEAILPPIEEIKKTLPESFILFKPKDIVSGDFYFYAHVRNTIVIAACDCTGHGVPGAFMSMIGSRLLDDIVYDKNVTDAAEILNRLRKGIIHALGEAGATGRQQDGMDMALCAFRHDKKNGNTKLQYAGAYNPLYIIRNNKSTQSSDDIEIIKADRQPVGYYYEGKEEQPFTNHDIELQKGDTIYIFSDGYQDQFGGPKGKKFSRSQFRELLCSVQDKNMSEQHDILNKAIEKWKGNEEQVDDILVIGMRF